MLESSLYASAGLEVNTVGDMTYSLETLKILTYLSVSPAHRVRHSKDRVIGWQTLALSSTAARSCSRSRVAVDAHEIDRVPGTSPDKIAHLSLVGSVLPPATIGICQYQALQMLPQQYWT